MPAILAWVDHDSKARERTLRILSLFQAKESRDELGLGSVRDSFADQLFPGTSTIQTRLRYMLFVPWIYQGLEKEGIRAENFAAQADKLERDLVQPLQDSDDWGVFGKTAGNQIKRLPSSVYWAGLGAWGIRLMPYSQDEYHRRIDEIYHCQKKLKALEKDAKARGDDIDVDGRKSALSWHPNLPTQPDKFPKKADFLLSLEEAEFIQDCIQENFPNSLLSFLALNCKPADVDAPWKHPDYEKFPCEHIELLTHARLFSETMHGASLSYNIQLAEQSGNEKLHTEHLSSLDNWRQDLPMDQIECWCVNRLWELTNSHGHTISYKTQNFVERWINLVRTSSEKLLRDEAKNIVKQREISIKGSRSRFKNKRALEQWGGYAGVGKLVYRWPSVKGLLKDLYQGIGR